MAIGGTFWTIEVCNDDLHTSIIQKVPLIAVDRPYSCEQFRNIIFHSFPEFQDLSFVFFDILLTMNPIDVNPNITIHRRFLLTPIIPPNLVINVWNPICNSDFVISTDLSMNITTPSESSSILNPISVEKYFLFVHGMRHFPGSASLRRT